MKNIKYEIVCSDIKFIELKLEKTRFIKQNLLENKPNILNRKKRIHWQNKINELEFEEKIIQNELEKAYIELGKLLK